jgi:hypothetical protein
MSTDLFRALKRTQQNTKALAKLQIQHQPKQVRLISFNLIEIIELFIFSSYQHQIFYNQISHY